MATDQNSIPKDLRPLNLPRTVVDEPRITVGRTMEGFCPNSVHDINSPGSRSVFYPATISDTGYGAGLGFVNPAIAWYPRQPAPVGSGFVPATGFRDRDIPNFVNRCGTNTGDQASDEGIDDPSPSRKVKLLCSFGGKILPRPSDGMLRYVGGQTRIISVRSDISFQELVQKMNDTCGQPVVFKYQLPDEDLDALVSVSCTEDLANMMEEYEKLVECSVDGSAKLRVFLFSASELDPYGTVRLGDSNDSGQKYIDAVNGIPDVVGCGITRKTSMTSVASTQNSDTLMSGGGDAVDSPSFGQGPPSPVILSPRVNSGASSHDGPTRLVHVGPNPGMYTEAQTANFGIPVVSGSHSPASLVEPEFERPVLAVGQQQQMLGHDLRPPSGMEFSPSTAYMQGYPHQEVLHPADYPPVSSQIGYLNHPQVLGIAGSTYRQADHPQQIQGNAVCVQPHQFIPAMQMTMPSTAHVSMRPNGVQHLMQPHQAHVKIAQSGDQNYKVLQSRPPPPQASVQLQGGVYDWHQGTVPENVAFSDGWSPHQQGLLPEQIPRYEDCHMCQKALPHAHSDTVAQDQRDLGPTMVSAPMPAFQSLRSEDSLRARPANRIIVSGPLGEGIVERLGARIRPKYVGPMDHDVAAPQLGIHGFPPNINVRVRNDNESSLLQNPESADHRRILCSPGVISDNLQSPYGLFLGNIPQSRQEDALQQPTVQFQYRDKHEPLMNQPVRTDMPPVRIIPFQTSEPVGHEFSEYSGKHSGNGISNSCISCDDLRTIDARMEALRISPPETSGSNESCWPPVNKLKKEEILDTRPQITRKEVPQTNAFTNPGILPDGNHITPIDMLPSSFSEATYLHNLQPEEPSQVSQPSVLGISGPFPQLNIGTQRLASDEIWHGKPAFSRVDSAYSNATDQISPVGEWEDEASRLQSRMVSDDTAAGPSRNNPPAISVFNGLVADSHDPAASDSLFSNQDPWSLRHDTHLPPPKPSKVPTSREAFVTREGVLHQPSGSLYKETTSEQANSSKGSAEEHIKQELQAVAEGVAASVLQSSLASDHSVHEMKEFIPEADQDREFHGDNVEAQDVAKLPDKTNPGLLISDGIGRLQIIKNSDLEELRELGSGTFGTVYHGKWRGSDVAIKRINDRCFTGKPSEQARMRDDFWNEAIKLADLHHPNVVAFYGVVLDGPGGSVATVTEYMVNGSLRQAFQRNDKTLDKRKRLLIAMDVAFGMEYLHGRNIVHFDLKSDNLLVNLRDPHRPICKVGDLGLSKVKCQTLISGGVRGTLPWMAPELLNGSSNLVSEKVDVFSFGMVMWELLTREEPYADLHYGAIIGGIVSNTLRPAVPESCDPEWRSLMERCWSSEPSERPSFTEIANQLRSMAASLPPKGQVQ
ncbi:Phox/Bem1p [Macleaya cordata]|uniref:Phox/Bem1p n=1 Tax=Macleaya cordata TaxID=56857 RepID=A0A200QR13_MACCD|nr:Phox/Bem1p [Macleaya cordata]